MKEKRKYHYFYKITNLLNNHFYYGVHNTNNLEDGYMGSGTRLRYAYKKYGIENFLKDVLKYFDTAKEAFEYEADYITEDLVKDSNCYNIQLGGKGWNTANLVTVKDKNGNYFDVHIEDPRYLSGELMHVSIGKVTCFDTIKNKIVNITKNEFDGKRYIGVTKGKIFVRKIGETERYYPIPIELYDKTIYEKWTDNKVPVKDKNNNYFLVDINDNRYKNGQLTHIWKDKHHKDETKQKMHETHLKNHHLQKEKNSQYGTCWIHNDNESIKIKKEQLEEYISNGWTKGRKMKF